MGEGGVKNLKNGLCHLWMPPYQKINFSRQITYLVLKLKMHCKTMLLPQKYIINPKKKEKLKNQTYFFDKI